MADVAREAGVSVSTVSHVINETRVIRPETRARVLDAVEKTGFVVNTLARSLATSTTATIGLAVSAVSNFYFAELVARIDAAVRAAGSTLLLADTHEDPGEELKIVQSLHRRRVDGILLAPVTGRDGAALQYLRDLKIPATLVDRCAAADFDQVGVENVDSTARLTAHLAAKGHRRIGLVAGITGIQTTIERTNGYRKALRSRRIRFDPALVVSGESTADRTEGVVGQLLGLADPPTALVVGNNHMTIGVLRALKGRGLRVPEDMALATFDDFDWADVFSPHLTAIAQPIDLIAGRAVSMLFERIAGSDGPPRTERPAGLWRHRESCGCRPGEQETVEAGG
ncbi:LacI family transcriptional regulator [Nakamurella sp. UYEF19]|uniref:LacI family DNA-binding transcriptional regulator n=1 Tax=Nakamurella sp. UYEF19 TaxID=1756392 RepID=UPI0033935CE4